MRARHLPVLLAALALVLAAPVSAQQYDFSTYNELDGMPSSTVYGLTQDREGVVWVATARGLTTYDGVVWQDENPLSGWPPATASFVGVDARGRIWCVTNYLSRIAYVRDEGRWEAYAFPAENRSAEGFTGFALGTSEDGRTVLAAAKPEGEISFCIEGEWRRLRLPAPAALVHSIRFHGTNLLACTGRGLYVIDPGTLQVVDHPITDPVLAVAAAPEGDLWIVGVDWIGRGTPPQVRVLASGLDLALELVNRGVVAVAGPAGGIYFGDIGQVDYFHPVYGLEKLSRANGLLAPGTSGLLHDREGNVWVAGLRGLSKLASRAFAGYDSRHGLYDDEVTAVLFRADGSTVLGHIGGLTLLDPSPHPVPFRRGNAVRERVSELSLGPDGRVWFAADQLGVGWLDETDRPRWVDDPSGLSRGAYAMFFDRDGTQWVGTARGVAHRRGDAPFAELPLLVDGNRREALIRRINGTRDGALVFATGQHGIFVLRDGVVKQVAPAPGTLGRQTFCTFETADGDLLVGTASGLQIVRDDVFEPAGPPWPRIDRPVYAITVDHEGRFWFGTDHGVMRWDGSGLRHLTVRDGLLGVETNRDAVKAGPPGEMWIGTDRGLTIFRGAFDRGPDAAPLLTLTGLVADGIRRDPLGAVRIGSPPHALEFSFRGVTFRDERRTRYLTWLEGFEPDWRGPEDLPSRMVRYTNVPAGKYRFHVQLETAAGSRSDIVTGGEVSVAPPLVGRPWFIGAMAVLVLVFIWAMTAGWANRRYAARLRSQVLARTADLERSEQLVRAESQRLAATLESISDGVVTLDPDRRIVMVNPGAERILGQGETELRGRAWQAAVSVEPPVRLASGEPTVHELAGADGKPCWLEFSVAPISDAERRTIGTVLAFRDTTARRELENQRLRAQQLESLGVLAGGIAHDFNNLLTIILGNVSLVEEARAVGDEERSRLQSIKAATESARDLTEQFLTFARGGDPKLVPASLSAIVKQTSVLAFSGSSSSCELDLPPDLWSVVVDRGQISQVLNNLFLNATQAMRGGGRVFVRARNCASCDRYGADRPCVVLEVHDQGTGIPAEDLERIFDPYFTTKPHGSGLGLAIAHSIVRRHGGLLTVASTPGRGSVFTLSLPATNEPVRPEADADPAGALPPGRILVLDDEVEVLDVCRRMLESLGQECTVTTDGSRTLQEYQAALDAGRPFDVVIMDLTVPGGLGGKETISALLNLDRQARAIVASGYSQDPVLAQFRQYGFQAALRKPYDREALQSVLHLVLTQRGITG